jgi:predicted  nucleic acid-binding Zn-ribbon protein
MKEDLKTISQVQMLDAGILSLRQRLEAIPGELSALDQREEAARREFDLVRHQKEESAKSRRAMEKELEAASEHLKKLNSQLTLVKTNKEYTAMLHEIETQKAAISGLEESILNQMELLDQLTAGEKDSSQRLESQKTEVQKQRSILSQEKDELEGKMAALQKDREVAMADLPREAATVYARVAQGRGGTAVVKVEGASCGGCFAKLPPQTVNEVRKMEALITCETCGRILIWPQDQA